MSAGEKRCSKCRETKPTAEFSANRANRDGLASWCKACDGGYRVARYATDPAYREAEKERQRVVRAAPEYRTWQREQKRRWRARKKAAAPSAGE
jgi:hypothetical protein